MGHVGADAAQSFHDLSEINFDVSHVDTEFMRLGRLMCDVSRFDQRFGRNASGDQTVATHHVSFDQGGLSTQHCGTTRRNKACSSRADRDHVINAIDWLGRPVFWMNVVT